MRITRRLAIVALPCAVILCGFLSSAFAVEYTPEAKQQFSRQMDDLKTRLNLTPDQVEKIRPLLQEDAQKIKAIRDKHAGDTSEAVRKQMLNEAEPVRKDFNKRIEQILSPEQRKEWNKIREERAEELKRSIKSST